MSLYNIAERLFPISASMSFVTYVSSIESLMELGREISGHKIDHCESCNQKKHEITKRFAEFIKTYSLSEVDDSEKTLKKIYAKRSKMSHSGELLEIDSIFSIFPVDEYQEIVSVSAYNRICLFCFILKTIYTPPEEADSRSFPRGARFDSIFRCCDSEAPILRIFGQFANGCLLNGTLEISPSAPGPFRF